TLSIICNTQRARYIPPNTEWLVCLEYAYGTDKRLDGRETLQISVNLTGPHSGTVCTSDCDGSLLKFRPPPRLGWEPYTPLRVFAGALFISIRNRHYGLNHK